MNIENNKYKNDEEQIRKISEESFPEIEEYDVEPVSNTKAIRGYQIVVVILALIVVAMSIAYLRIHGEQKAEQVLLQEDKNLLQADLDSLITALDSREYQNDTLTQYLQEARQLVKELENERTLNYNKLRQYQKEVGTLRTIMQGYLRQIDSLNNVNAKLVSENTSMKKTISTERLRAEMAEEQVEELENQVKIASVLKAEQINMTLINKKGKEVSRVNKAAKARVDFILVGNEIANPGKKNIYLCIYGPEGYPISNADLKTFSFEGTAKTYSAVREVEYQNQALEASIFMDYQAFTKGTYKIELYCDGHLIGIKEADFK